MKRYKKVLACVDLSKISETVITQASEMANFNDAYLVVLYVNQDMPAASDPFGEPPSLLLDVELRQQLEKRAQQELKELVKQADLPELVPVETIDGNPKAVILEYVEKHQIDLVVMGRHKRVAILDFLGSTAKKVLYKVQADVLLIADNAKD